MPRKASTDPARSVTFSLKRSIEQRMIDAGLWERRSKWLGHIIEQHIINEEAIKEAREANHAEAERLRSMKADPAAFLGEIPTRRLAASLLARIDLDERNGGKTRKQLKQNLVRLLKDPDSEMM